MNGRLDYQTDNDNDYTESLFERNEDAGEHDADDRNDDAKMLRDEWKKMKTPDEIRETENLKK